MAKRKTEFDLINQTSPKNKVGKIAVVGIAPKYDPYVRIEIDGKVCWMIDWEIETFALNILKALKSKHLKP